MHYHSEALIKELSAQAQSARIQVLDMVYDGKTGHLGGAFSCAEILACLMLHHMRLDPERPNWPDRDRLLFSKGHACAMLYTMMAYRGFFAVDELMTFRKLDSRLQGHPDRIKLPGIEVPAGPLGHGVAIAAGMCLAARMRAGREATPSGSPKPSAYNAPSAQASPYRAYVVLGDGELNAGVVWEGVMTAAKYGLGNMTAIVDYNGIQQTGATAEVMPTEPIADKWQSFGWHVQEVDGHNVAELLNALDRANEVHARPSVIIARTTKGKGVSFMEYDHRWHGQSPDETQYAQAKQELEEGLATWQK